MGPQPLGHAARTDVGALVLDERGPVRVERRPFQRQPVLVALLRRLRRQSIAPKAEPRWLAFPSKSMI